MLVCHAKDWRHAKAVKTTANVMLFPYLLVRSMFFARTPSPWMVMQPARERVNKI